MGGNNNADLPSDTEDSEHSDVFSLLETWELSSDAIKMVLGCGVNTLPRLQMLNSDDIGEIFNTRSLIGEKITFRYFLQKWRAENNVCIKKYISRYSLE